MHLILAAVLALSSPAQKGSSSPHLATRSDGTVIMSWLEGGTLKFSTLAKGAWSTPRVITDRKDLFVNWADFPSIVDDGKGALYAHWLQKSGASAYAYDVWITRSADGGKTWRAPVLVNRDGKEGEHGFATLVGLPAGGVGLAWLDGRAMSEGDGGHHHGSMQLRYAEVDAALELNDEKVIDERTCECCTTAMAMTGAGPVIAYRDRSAAEVRDISVVRRTRGGWSAPATLRADGWKIEGCPVNGPQLDARGSRVAAAWFTAAHDKPRVNLAFSSDAGATFGKPVRVDSDAVAAGRVDVVMLADGSAVVVWIENAGKEAAIFARRVYSSGRAGSPIRVATVTTARAAGFPRATVSGDTAYIAWTDVTAKQVRVASLQF